MKTTFRTLMLAAAGVLGHVAVASAQTPTPPAPPPPATSADPAAPPAPAASPDAPAADPGAAPAAAPSAAAPAPGTPTDPNAPAAQPAPGLAAPEAPGAATPAPAAPPPAPPVAPPPAPPAVTFGTGATAPESDTTTEPTEHKESDFDKLANRFRFSWFTWDQSATTTALGVGRDNIGSEDEQYSWEFAFTPRFYVVDTPKHQAYVNARVAWQTELTNSNTTTKERQTLFEDMSLGAGYFYTAYQSKDKGTRWAPGLTGSLSLPTSDLSREQGKYMSTSLTLGSLASFKLLGEKAPGLNSVIVSAGLTWSHLFARSYNATNSDFVRTRQDASGRTMLSDQFGMHSFAQNRLRMSLTYFFPVVGDLYFANSWALTENYKHKYSKGGGSGCDVSIMSGSTCVDAAHVDDPTTRSVSTLFDVSLSYDFFDSSLRWAVGYQNDTDQIADDGKYRSVFYSPGSTFYMDVIVMFDGVMKQVHNRLDRKVALSNAMSQMRF